MSDVQTSLSEADNNAPQEQKAKHIRKKAFKIFVLILIVVALVYLVWRWLTGNEVETDNAYVGANTAHITSMVSGQVQQVLVNDTQIVKKGDILLQLDDRDAKIALAQAQAQLAKAQRLFKQNQANNSALGSQVFVSNDAIASAQAQVAKAQADYAKAQDDYSRRQQLVTSGAISKEELATVRAAVNTAKAALDVAKAGLAQAQSNHKAAQSQLAAGEALIQGTTVNDSPDVLVAKANVQQAQLNLERTVIRAPVDGVVTERKVQLGQRIAPGSVVMQIVPIQQLYVDANFKESQLARVKVGQDVTLTSDLYGSDVVYHGKVVGLAGGTGSAFALIPAQNATGNWIKVVQRLPVRIALNPKELAEHPLRVGLSMKATVDVSQS